MKKLWGCASVNHILAVVFLTACPLGLQRTLWAWREFPTSVGNVSICMEDRRTEGKKEKEKICQYQYFSYSDPAFKHLARELKQKNELESWEAACRKCAIMRCVNLFLVWIWENLSINCSAVSHTPAGPADTASYRQYYWFHCIR